jgi:hypothetical protein
LMMIPAILEKATYVVALTILVTAGRIPIQVFRQCWPDLILGTLFAAAFVRTRPVTG